MSEGLGSAEEIHNREDGTTFQVRARYVEDRFFGEWTCLKCGEIGYCGSEDRNVREALDYAKANCHTHHCDPNWTPPD
jgi:hypothetical protein